jgi:glycosyltransferase involved in cell wall biosynthesis
MLDLTIAIPAKNEETNLPGCLAAIGTDFASQIILIDSSSTDSTRDIAKKFNVGVVDFVWDGKFPKKRNWFLRNHKPKTEWVLFLDADEYLTDDFKQEVSKCLKKNDKVGYWLNYTRYFLDKKLKGGYPLKKLALFKVEAGEYERIDEDKWSKLDMEVHEHPVLEGNVGVIHSEIDHKDFRGISHYVIKHNDYAAWEAERFLKTVNDPETYSKLTWKQKLKYRLMKSIFIGPVYFLGSFFLMGGFRDGYRGLAFAILKMSYFTQIYCKIKEKNLS